MSDDLEMRLSDALMESLDEGNINSLEEILKENGDENTEIEILSLEDEDERKPRNNNLVMDLVRQSFDFICNNLRYIVLGIALLILLCNYRNRLQINTGLDEHLKNACDFLQTSLGESSTSELVSQQSGGALDNEATSSLDSMSSTSGTSIH